MLYHYFFQKKGILIACFSLITIVSAYAQEKVSGTVVSARDHSPLVGVSVSVKGSEIGTTTNTNGDYSLQVPHADATLVFSYLGYSSKSVAVNGSPRICKED